MNKNYMVIYQQKKGGIFKYDLSIYANGSQIYYLQIEQILKLPKNYNI